MSVQGNQNLSHSHGGTTGNDSPDHSHGASISLTSGGGSNYYQTGRVNNGNGPEWAGGLISIGGASTRHQHSISNDGGNEARPNNFTQIIWKRIS